MTKRTCQVCTHTFTAKRTDARTCSGACRSRARFLADVRGYVVRNAKRALSDVVEAHIGIDDDAWTALMGDIGQHLLSEVERFSQEVRTDDREG